MLVTIEKKQINITNFRYTTHSECVLCGQFNSDGMKLDFLVHPDQSVSATIDTPEKLTGYKGRLHGGILSAFLDSAMTNCLAAQEIIAVTAEMTIRYKQPVQVGQPLTIRAWPEKITSLICYMKSEIIQNGMVKVAGKAKFMEQKDLDESKGMNV